MCKKVKEIKLLVFEICEQKSYNAYVYHKMLYIMTCNFFFFFAGFALICFSLCQANASASVNDLRNEFYMDPELTNDGENSEVDWSFYEMLGGRSSSAADVRDMIVWRVNDLGFDGASESVYMVHDR